MQFILRLDDLSPQRLVCLIQRGRFLARFLRIVLFTQPPRHFSQFLTQLLAAHFVVLFFRRQLDLLRILDFLDTCLEDVTLFLQSRDFSRIRHRLTTFGFFARGDLFFQIGNLVLQSRDPGFVDACQRPLGRARIAPPMSPHQNVQVALLLTDFLRCLVALRPGRQRLQPFLQPVNGLLQPHQGPQFTQRFLIFFLARELGLPVL